MSRRRAVGHAQIALTSIATEPRFASFASAASLSRASSAPRAGSGMEQQTEHAGESSESIDLSVPEALGLAVRCQRTGDLDAAERLYGAVLELVPEHPDA